MTNEREEKMGSYIHRVVNNFMLANGGGWSTEFKNIPDGYRLDRIIPLDVYSSCMIFIKPTPSSSEQQGQS